MVIWIGQYPWVSFSRKNRYKFFPLGSLTFPRVTADNRLLFWLIPLYSRKEDAHVFIKTKLIEWLCWTTGKPCFFCPSFFLSSFFPTLTIISSVVLSFWNLHPFCRKSKKSRMTYFHSEKVSNEQLIIIIIFANRLSLCMWMVRNKRWLRIRRRWIW